jgi:hypothetical protein
MSPLLSTDCPAGRPVQAYAVNLILVARADRCAAGSKQSTSKHFESFSKQPHGRACSPPKSRVSAKSSLVVSRVRLPLQKKLGD